MTSGLRRSFKQKAKEAFGLPFRFRMGLEKLDSGGTEEFATRSASFDLGYFTPINHDGETDAKVAAELQQGSLGEDYVMITEQDRESKKKPRTFVQPKGTLSYTVSSTDTLPSIAAQFETTTSELKKLNRLMSEMVFPGKIIFIPDKDYVPSELSSRASTPTPPPREEGEQKGEEAPMGLDEATDYGYLDACNSTEDAIPSSSLRVPDPDLLLMGVKPILSVARQTALSPATGTVGDAAKQTDEDWHEQFIKLNVNHITDAKEDVIGGVLLVTPNAVMFESNADDELVIKNGRDAYDVIVPMAVIVGVTICHERAPAAKPSLKEASSFEDDVFDTKTERSSSVSKASKTLTVESTTILKDTAATGKLHSGNEGTLTAIGDSRTGGGSETVGGSGTGGSSETAGGIVGGGEDCSLADLLSGKNDKVDDKGEGKTREVEGEEFSDHKEERSRLTPPPPPPDVSSCETGVLSSDETLLQPSPPVHLETPCQTLESFTESHPPKAEATTQGGNTTNKDQGTADEAKQTKPNNKEPPLSESSTGLETPSKRCSNLVSNIFRFQSANDATTGQTSERSTEREGDVVEPGGKEPEGGSQTPTHRLMTRTLESLSSYSKPLVDLSSSLFSRSGSDSKSPKREDDRPEFESFKDKEKDQCGVEPVLTQRFFFLRPFDMLTKRGKGSSAELTEEASASEQERSSVSGPEEPSTLYMCLKIGQFVDWSALKHCPMASYIRTRLKPEYWFTIPSNRVDQLYAFFLQWSPNISGAVDEINLVERGFVVISSTDGATGLDDEFNKLTFPGTSSSSTNKEWEIINAKEVRRMINVAEIESLPLPELSEVSRIMNNTHVRELCFHLPPRAEGCPWQLVYSSDKHGFSLKTLYRQMLRVDSPVLLIIKDDSNLVFGAMLPCALKMSDSFYGSGESYLFSFHPAFRKFSWTGQNNYFIKGNAASLSIGAGEGVYGLWLDGDLYHGRTQPCLTYDNDLLTVAEDFMIQCLEVWKFV